MAGEPPRGLTGHSHTTTLSLEDFMTLQLDFSSTSGLL